MNPWLIWQIADSSFPTGGFAHSWGLEAAWQAGEVPDDAGLQRFVRESLTTTGYSLLPFVSAAHGDPSALPALDARCDAFLSNGVANRASRVQGHAWLSTCARTWPGPALDAIERDSRRLSRHGAPMFGAVLRALDVELHTTRELFLFMTLRGALGAAVRLGIVGSYRAQRLQHESVPHLAAVLDRCGGLAVEDAAQSAPIADLLQGVHDRLYSRLFQS